MSEDPPYRAVTSLQQLRQLLAQSENGLKEFVFSRLLVGDVWLIPDDESGFSHKTEHPWVIIHAYDEKRPYVTACPRTRQLRGKHRGIITPPGIVPGLDAKGLILLAHRVKFEVERFREWTYLGRFSDEWIRKIKDQYRIGLRTGAIK